MSSVIRRIALTVEGEALGGAELSLVNLLSTPQTDPFDVVLVGPPTAAVERLGRLLDIDTVTTKGTKDANVADYRRLFQRVRPDLLQATLCNPAACLNQQLAAHSLGIDVIAIEQLVRGVTRPQRLTKMATSRLLVDHVAVGESSARRTERLFKLPGHTVRTIYNGIPPDLPATPAAGLPPWPSGDGPSIITVARLEQQKGIEHLIDALVNIPDAHLVLVGDGTLRRDLENRTRQRRLSDRVTFLGWVDNARHLLPHAEVFVLPSLDEAFPLTIVEAMLARVPVVATAVGSVAEAVTDNETGLLVPPGDPEALADAVNRALAAPADRQRWVDEAERRTRGRFTASAMADGYVSMWQQPRGRLRPAVPGSFGTIVRGRSLRSKP